MSIAQLNNQLNNIFLPKFPNWRGFCGGNHWKLFLQPKWKYEHRMVYLSKLSIKTSVFRALYFRWRQWNEMFPMETTFVAHDNNEVLTVKLGHETSLVAYSTDKHSSWRTSLSLDTRESLVLPEEFGCTSCFGTESAFQHWRKQSVSNTRVDPGRKYGCTSCPKTVLLWVVAHLPSRTMHKVSELRGASILIEICFELARGALSQIVHFVSRHVLRWLEGKR